MTEKARALIVKPQEQPELVHHVEGKLPDAYQPRLLHLSSEMVPGADIFITSRSVIGLAEPTEPNVLPHRHAVSQTYLFFGSDDGFEVDVEIEGKHCMTRAPATAFIPAGVEHSLRILRGTGMVISIVRSGTYD